MPSTSSPSVVVFDLGKVLVDFDYSIAARRIGAHLQISLDEVHHYLSHSPLIVRYETGLISRRQFFQEIRRVTGFDGTLEEFGESFADIFTEIPAMIETHAALREQGVPTYILSNTNDLAVTHIRRSFPFFQNFDGYVFSHEVGSMKPDARIYEALERMTAKRGDEIFYVDDRPENVEAGARRGWRAVLHETPERTRLAMRRLGILNHR